MDRKTFCTKIRALAQDPEEFVKKFENDARNRELEPTYDLFVDILNKLYNIGAVSTTQVLLLSIYYYNTENGNK